MDGVSYGERRVRKEALEQNLEEPQLVRETRRSSGKEAGAPWASHGGISGNCSLHELEGPGAITEAGRSLPAGLVRTSKRAQETQTSQEEKERERNMGGRMF